VQAEKPEARAVQQQPTPLIRGIRAHRLWQQDSPTISGVSLNCCTIRSLLLLGWNPKACGDGAKRLSVIRHSQNDREDVLASILYPIQLDPNDHEGVLARLLDHLRTPGVAPSGLITREIQTQRSSYR